MQHTVTAPAKPAPTAAPATAPAAIGTAAPPVDTTETLTRAIARGDTRAFGVLYERWFDRAYSMAQRLTGRDEAFCLDVVQDTMLKTARRIPILPDETALSAWLCRVVHRTALDRLRSERRRSEREQSRPGASERPGTDLDAQIAWLRAQLSELPAADRGLLASRFARGRTLAQAGDEQGITGDAAHGRLRRVLGLLRRNAQRLDERNMP